MPVRPHIQDPFWSGALYMTGGKGAFAVDEILRMSPGFINRLLKNLKAPGVPGQCFPLAFVPFLVVHYKPSIHSPRSTQRWQSPIIRKTKFKKGLFLFSSLPFHCSLRPLRSLRRKVMIGVPPVIQIGYFFCNHFRNRTGTRVREIKRLKPTPIRATVPMDRRPG